jgi:rod shape-determining protein MreD
VNLIKHILLLILAFVLQTTWAHSLAIVQIKPDLLVLTLVYIALASGPLRATLLAFCFGFIQDTYAPANLGLNVLVKSAVAFAVGWSRSEIMSDNIAVQVAFVAGAVLVHDLIFYIGYSGLAWGDVPFFWLRYSLGSAVYTAALAAVLSYGLLLRRYFLPSS